MEKGLDGLLRTRHLICKGIVELGESDYDIYNPETDPEAVCKL
ncbi:MAG: hypothetical protein ACLUD0_07355 [Eubacterium ramulus]